MDAVFTQFRLSNLVCLIIVWVLFRLLHTFLITCKFYMRKKSRFFTCSVRNVFIGVGQCFCECLQVLHKLVDPQLPFCFHIDLIDGPWDVEFRIGQPWTQLKLLDNQAKYLCNFYIRFGYWFLLGKMSQMILSNFSLFVPCFAFLSDRCKCFFWNVSCTQKHIRFVGALLLLIHSCKSQRIITGLWLRKPGSPNSQFTSLRLLHSSF